MNGVLVYVGLAFILGLVLMVIVGYGEALGGQLMDVATNLRYVVTGFTQFSYIHNFIAVKFIYPLDKKPLTQMSKELGREA